MTVVPTVALLLALGAPAVRPAAPDTALRLLFVGNSLTYVHDVPSLVKRLATAAGKPAPTITMRASPNYGLEDHWKEGWVGKALAKGHYDLLIMQQGPSTLAASGADLERWAKVLADEAAQHGTKVALYGVWAPASGGMEASMANYRAAAVAVNAACYPVAAAWQAAWRIRPMLPLYGLDGFHASEHGAMLAAMVIAGAVFDADPAAMPNLFKGTITNEEMAVLRTAAAEAVRATGTR